MIGKTKREIQRKGEFICFVFIFLCKFFGIDDGLKLTVDKLFPPVPEDPATSTKVVYKVDGYYDYENMW